MLGKGFLTKSGVNSGVIVNFELIVTVLSVFLMKLARCFRNNRQHAVENTDSITSSAEAVNMPDSRWFRGFSDCTSGIKRYGEIEQSWKIKLSFKMTVSFHFQF